MTMPKREWSNVAALVRVGSWVTASRRKELIPPVYWSGALAIR